MLISYLSLYEYTKLMESQSWWNWEMDQYRKESIRVRRVLAFIPCTIPNLIIWSVEPYFHVKMWFKKGSGEDRWHVYSLGASTSITFQSRFKYCKLNHDGKTEGVLDIMYYIIIISPKSSIFFTFDVFVEWFPFQSEGVMGYISLTHYMPKLIYFDWSRFHLNRARINVNYITIVYEHIAGWFTTVFVK